MAEPLLLPAKDAFRELGLGRDTGYALVRDGRLRAVRVSGRRLLIPRSELSRFIERELGEEVIETIGAQTSQDTSAGQTD